MAPLFSNHSNRQKGPTSQMWSGSTHGFKTYKEVYHEHVWGQGPGGGGGGHSTFMWTGGAAVGRKPDPVANRSVHKNTPVTIYLTKNVQYAYPVAILHRRWCPDRGPVINIVGWEALGATL